MLDLTDQEINYLFPIWNTSGQSHNKHLHISFVPSVKDLGRPIEICDKNLELMGNYTDLDFNFLCRSTHQLPKNCS